MFSDKMFGLCYYYSSNRQDAEDLLHDGFIRLFEHINKFESGNFEAWMRKIFVNLALMNYRKNKKFDTEAPKDFGDEYHFSDNKVNSDALMDLISKLPTQYKLVFNLYALEGYKHKEIAEMLGISEGTSKSNLSRARQLLQEKLKVEEEV